MQQRLPKLTDLTKNNDRCIWD